MTARTTDLPVFPVKRTDPLGVPADYAAMRRDCPVTRVRLEDGGGEAWLVTGYREAREVLGSKRFSSDSRKPGFPLTERFRRAQQEGSDSLGRTLIRMDPPEHTRYRRMMSPEFVIQRIEAMRPQIQEITDGLLDEMGVRTPPADLVQSFALPLPSLVICEVLGVPASERPRFERMSRDIVTVPGTSPDRFQRIAREFRDYMEDLVARKQELPGDDLLSRMIEWEAAGGLTHDEVVDMGRLLLLAGHVTTANMIGLGVIMLLEHPGTLAELRAGPALAANAVEELLRHQTLLQGGLRRVAVEDVDVGGQLIRAGEGVVVLISAANRDAAIGLGDEFDIHRGVRHHLAFGYGFHQCLGQLLARVELQVALVSVALRFPDLALAVPLEQVALRDDGFLHGVRELPVTW